jgi:hypothetical protein
MLRAREFNNIKLVLIMMMIIPIRGRIAVMEQKVLL